VSSDFTSAKVYFSVMGDEEDRSDTERGLRSASNFMRKAVADELKLRNAPELRFVYDDSLDRAMGIERALSEDEKHRQDESAVEKEKPEGDS
jgi:ribosome-binding factor A